MRPGRLAIWSLALLAGLMLMFLSYWRFQRVRRPTRWTRARMYVAEEQLGEEAGSFGGRRARARFLPLPQSASLLAAAICGPHRDSARWFTRNTQEKVLLMPDFYAGFTQEMLASGRLPKPAAPEVLAGHATARRDEVPVAAQPYRVVGVLQRDESPLCKAYLIPDHRAHRRRFDLADDSVKEAFLLTAAEGKQIKDRVKSLFPRKRFPRVTGVLRAKRGAYYVYLAGMLLLLVGGSALLTGGLGWAAGKSATPWIGPALAEIGRRRRLLLGLHGAYFGLCLASMLLIYEFPYVQDALLAAARGEVQGESGLLGTAGKAYRSGNVARAALVTLGINFCFGSFTSITLPSMVVPGAGVLVALFRAVLWGILLGPVRVEMARGMLPHGFTLLLEGEAYILASFFALLVPIYLVRRQPDTEVLSRYGRAILVNLQGSLLVLAVLAVAALYEAIEVILQMKG